MSEQPTPEQIQQAQEESAKNEALMVQIMEGATMAERTAAARAVGVLAPATLSPETRVVLRMLRTADGKWWAGIEGADGTIAQVVLEDPAQMLAVLSRSAALVCYPLMTDEEHATQKARESQ